MLYLLNAILKYLIYHLILVGNHCTEKVLYFFVCAVYSVSVMKQNQWCVVLLKRLIKLFFQVVCLSYCVVFAQDLENDIKSEEDYLEIARQNLSISQFKTAAKSYENLQSFYPFGDQAEIARLEVIYAYYSAHDFGNALESTQRFQDLHPKSQFMDYVIYMQGLIESRSLVTGIESSFLPDLSKRDLRDLTKAFVTFKTLIESHPNSIYLSDAYQRAKEIKEIIAENMIQTADFYYQIEANLSAADRAIDYLKFFYGMRHTDLAFEILIDSLEREQLNIMSDDVQMVYQASLI